MPGRGRVPGGRRVACRRTRSRASSASTPSPPGPVELWVDRRWPASKMRARGEPRCGDARVAGRCTGWTRPGKALWCWDLPVHDPDEGGVGRGAAGSPRCGRTARCCWALDQSGIVGARPPDRARGEVLAAFEPGLQHASRTTRGRIGSGTWWRGRTTTTWRADAQEIGSVRHDARGDAGAGGDASTTRSGAPTPRASPRTGGRCSSATSPTRRGIYCFDYEPRAQRGCLEPPAALRAPASDMDGSPRTARSATRTGAPVGRHLRRPSEVIRVARDVRRGPRGGAAGEVPRRR